MRYHLVLCYLIAYFYCVIHVLKFAYRITEHVDETTILKHDNDDDGEQGAGSRLAQLLAMRKDEGVLVVVSRWFGGIHLGPKRFSHIINTARELLEYVMGPNFSQHNKNLFTLDK